ncbi:hypothetical protein [Nocardioides sp. 503]|uniref:hypothetical protein n=1 Tax=Nocardioides sp. 503 TaxID=2508326 RepID=UPI001431CF48|nr:hypothetical protein [Nocardioides sp. 503]
MSESPTTDDELTGEPFDTPPGEHASELPDEQDDPHTGPLQEENAGTTEDQPSQ